MAADPKNPVEFDPQLNEYHLMQKGDGGYSLMYFCPWCGGKTPQSQRGSLSHSLTDAERQRLAELTKNLRTEQEVIAALGEPDGRQPGGMRFTVSEMGGVPETTQSCNVLTYTRLSDLANLNVLVYPTGKVGISFHGKPRLVQQTHESRMMPSPQPPEPEPQIDATKRYDVYCIEPDRAIVVYRNALFKGSAALLPHPGGRMHYPEYVELEQANGQSIFIPRSSIFRFCKPGTALAGEVVESNRPNVR
jgi:hypothetical protein